jgi:hypothetical protein
MARFISILSGTPTIPQFHDQLTIANGSTKRTGLIASRSALSIDIYNELLPENKDGSKGIYFPPDEIVVAGGNVQGVAYTSTIPGIVIPANYSTRPTASVLSTNTNLTITNPKNSATASFATYTAAATAVKDTLDSIQNGGPYGRLGLNPSRTLHSIYHDPDVLFFAWDDFTPGTPRELIATSSLPVLQSIGLPAVYLQPEDTLILYLGWQREFLADALGTQVVSAQIVRMSNGQNTGTPLVNQNVTTGNPEYVWITPATTLGFDGQGFITYGVRLTASFSDITIPSHVSANATTLAADVVAIQRIHQVFAYYTSTGVQETLCNSPDGVDVFVNNTTILANDAGGNTPLLFSDAGGTTGPAGLYTDPNNNVNGGRALNWDGGAGTFITLSCTSGGATSGTSGGGRCIGEQTECDPQADNCCAPFVCGNGPTPSGYACVLEAAS